MPSKYEQLNNSEWVQEQYNSLKRTISEIASEVGCDSGSVRHALKRIGIPIRKNIKYPQLHDEMWLRSKYEQEHLTTAEIAALIGCSKDGVRVALLRYKIELRLNNESLKLRHKREGRKSRKYQQLNDEQWLRQKYLEEKLTCLDIRRLVKADQTVTIVDALSNFGINRREDDPAGNNLSKPLPPELKDETWLIAQHYENGKTIGQIAHILEVGRETVSKAFKELSISHVLEQMRSRRELLWDCDLIDGGLLGDAWLDCGENYPNTSVALVRTNKFFDHVYWNAEQLGKDIDTGDIRPTQITKEGKRLRYWTYSTASQEQLHKEYSRWYKNNIKIVPPDVTISEKSLLAWFMDDGSTSYRVRDDGIVRDGTTKGSKGSLLVKQVRLVFCSESFTKEEQQFLCNQFNAKFDLEMRLRPYTDGTGYRIHIPQSKTDHFFNTIGPCPTEIPSLAYKWK